MGFSRRSSTTPSNNNARDPLGGAVRARWVFLCALLSGAAGLTYEVLWNRSLLLHFGSTTQSAAAVLASFLGGMALGSWLIAMFGAKVRSPLVVYAAVEVGIAGYAIVFDPVHRAAAQSFGALVTAVGGVGSFAVPFVSGGAALLLPTAAMGAALPLLALALSRSRGEDSSGAGSLYGANTLGATLGAFAAGFFLIPALGMRGTRTIAIGLGLAAATVAWAAGRTTRSQPAQSSGSLPAAEKPAALPSPWMAAAVILASLAALGYEVVWTRLLVLVIGSSTYAFTLVVAVFVLGVSLGSLGFERLIPRFRNAAEVYVHLQIATAVLSVLALKVFGRLPELFLSWFGAANGAFTGTLVAQAGVVALMLLPPTVAIGASFPVAVRAVAVGPLAQSAFARVFAWMSAGNVLGVIVASVWLIPALGLQQSLGALAAANVAAAAVLLSGAPSLRGRVVTLATGLGLPAALWFLPPRWDPMMMTSGVYASAPLYRELAGGGATLARLLRSYRLRYYREGSETVVSVVERPTLSRTPYLALAVDGKVDASSGRDMSTQILSGHIPLVFHPNPRDVLIIGLASGVAVGSVAAHPVHHITAVEIEPAMVDAARTFGDFNRRALDDPRVAAVIDDGRHLLTVENQRFDVIISEPSNPWMSGPARLFTDEFFGLAKGKLQAGGVFAQWIPLYGLGAEHFRSLFGTRLDVFPHAAAFRVTIGCAHV